MSEQQHMILIVAAMPVAAYLIGSVPFGLLIGLSRGVDVRRQGSGNIGATNVGRVLGQPWGYICFALDLCKGLGPVLAAGVLLQRIFPAEGNQPISPGVQWAWLAVAAAGIIGHMFPIFLRFRGGKGVATSLGVVLGFWPYFTLSGLAAFAVWVIVWLIWRYVSLASIVAAVMLPTAFAMMIGYKAEWRLVMLWPLMLFSSLMALLVIVRHRANIARLLAGTELSGRQAKKENGQ